MKAIRQHSHRTGALSADERSTIIRMSDAGATTAEIAKALGRPSVHMGMTVAAVKRRCGSRAAVKVTKKATAARPGETEAETIARHIRERGVTKVADGRATNTVIARGLDLVL